MTDGTNKSKCTWPGCGAWPNIDNSCACDTVTKHESEATNDNPYRQVDWLNEPIND